MLLSLSSLPLIRLQHPAADAPLQLPPANGYFGCLLITHAAPGDHATALIDALLDHGCVYFCCWGVACEQWHDLADDRILLPDRYTADISRIIMTTWHDNEPCDEALWFLQNLASPGDAFEQDYLWQLALEIGARPSAN